MGVVVYAVLLVSLANVEYYGCYQINGRTALHWLAVKNGEHMPSTLKALCECGVDASDVVKLLSITDKVCALCYRRILGTVYVVADGVCSCEPFRLLIWCLYLCFVVLY